MNVLAGQLKVQLTIILDLCGIEKDDKKMNETKALQTMDKASHVIQKVQHSTYTTGILFIDLILIENLTHYASESRRIYTSTMVTITNTRALK